MDRTCDGFRQQSPIRVGCPLFRRPWASGRFAVPWLGAAPRFLLDKPGFLATCHRQSGDTVRLDIGGPTLLLADPVDVRHVLVTGADAYGQSQQIIGSAARKSLGDNLFTAEGDHHVSLRRDTARVFRPRVLATRLPLIERRCEEFVKGAVARGVIDSLAHVALWAAACVVEALLGADIATQNERWPGALERRRREVDATVARQSFPLVRRWGGSRPIDAGLAAVVDDALDNTEDRRRRADSPPRHGAAVGTSLPQAARSCSPRGTSIRVPGVVLTRGSSLRFQAKRALYIRPSP